MEKELEMTLEEIVRSYREAKDKAAQLEILADLNVCSREEIRRVLLEGGVKQQELPRKRTRRSEVAEETVVEAPVDEGLEVARRRDLVEEALKALKGKLMDECIELQEEFLRIKEEFLATEAELKGKINAIDVMLEEAGG